MEIKYEGANRKIGYYPLIKESPMIAGFDTNNVLTLELKDVHIDHKDGRYDIKITLSADEIGIIVAEFCKRALTKNK